MAKIIVLDDLSQDGLDLLQSAGNIEVVIRTGLKGEDLRKALLEADGAICRSGVKITAEVLAGNRRLRAIARAGVGVDNIDTQAATRQGIVVMNTPGGNTVSTAEHTLALMLGLSRNLAAAHQSLVEKRWDRKKFMGSQLAGKTLGIVGLGRIGSAVAVRALALEMRVVGYDPFLSAARAKEMGIQTVNDVRGDVPPGRLPHGPYAAERRDAKPDRHQGSGPAEEGHPADQLRPRRHLRRASPGRGAPQRAARRRGPGRLWRPSRAPTARCSVCPTSSARRIWGPAPRRPKPTWPSRPPNS